MLTSTRSTLERKVLKRGSGLFGTEAVVRHGGRVGRCEAILASNRLLFTADLVREQLTAAYALRDEYRMRLAIDDIVCVCESTGERHFQWFARLLANHIDGIAAHARHGISSGRVEGTNNRIKTIRRQGYGYPDDEYFFLKIMDSTRRPYTANPESHKFRD